MDGIQIVKGVSGVVTTASTVIGLLFVNFLARRANSTIFGVEIPSGKVHSVLGPVLVILNSVLLVYVCALWRTDVTAAEVEQIKAQSRWRVLGFLINPFYVGQNRILSGIGYAFLIILWWLGLHAFLYSLSIVREPQSPWIFGWQVLICVMYLALGLASMIAIQACWQKFGIEAYTVKWVVGFIGIPLGAFLPPLLLRLGLPRLA